LALLPGDGGLLVERGGLAGLTAELEEETGARFQYVRRFGRDEECCRDCQMKKRRRAWGAGFLRDLTC